MKCLNERRHKRRRKWFRASSALVAVVGTLWPYMFSIAASADTTFSLINHTRYYLHASLNNQTFVYIAPGGSVALDVKAPTSVYAKVRYSPGQTVKGTGERTVDIQATTTSTEGASDCNNTNQANTCNSTEPTSTTTANPARWDVLPSDVKAE